MMVGWVVIWSFKWQKSGEALYLAGPSGPRARRVNAILGLLHGGRWGNPIYGPTQYHYTEFIRQELSPFFKSYTRVDPANRWHIGDAATDEAALSGT